MPDDINIKLYEYFTHRYPEVIKSIQNEKTFESIQSSFNKAESKWIANVEFHTGQKSVNALFEYKLSKESWYCVRDWND